jgi:predicted chitinase/LysM repeat protein
MTPTLTSGETPMGYTVRSGDTLSGIAARNKISLSALEKANPQIRDPNSISVGEQIKIPGKRDAFQSTPSTPKKASRPAHAAKGHPASHHASTPASRLQGDLAKMTQALRAEKQAEHGLSVDTAAEKKSLSSIADQVKSIQAQLTNPATPLDAATQTKLLGELFTLGQLKSRTQESGTKTLAADKQTIAKDAREARTLKGKALKELLPAEYEMNLSQTNKARKELGLKPVKKVIRPTGPVAPRGFRPLTPAQFASIAPNLGRNAATYTKYLNEAMIRFHITTPQREAAFIAQITEETDGMNTLTEYASGSEYEGRADLGNTHPGDGPRYKGRGAIQLTGRANYANYGAKLGLDLINHPSRAADPSVAFLIAGQYWSDHGLNGLADQGDFVDITRRINGGTNGLSSREAYWSRAKRALGI